MDISDNNKVIILQSLLIERYNASHKMRERSLKFSLWVFGFIVMANGWLITYGASLELYQRVTFTVFTIIIFLFTIYFLRDIKIGFNNNRKVIIKIEKALGCYEKGEYLESESLFPIEYKTTNSSVTKGHFATIYAWVIIACLLTIASIWVGTMSDYYNVDKNENTDTELIMEE